MLSRLPSFLDAKEFLQDFQLGFWANHSTEHACAAFLNFCHSPIDSGHIPAALCLMFIRLWIHWLVRFFCGNCRALVLGQTLSVSLMHIFLVSLFQLICFSGALLNHIMVPLRGLFLVSIYFWFMSMIWFRL